MIVMIMMMMMMMDDALYQNLSISLRTSCAWCCCKHIKVPYLSYRATLRTLPYCFDPFSRPARLGSEAEVLYGTKYSVHTSDNALII